MKTTMRYTNRTETPAGAGAGRCAMRTAILGSLAALCLAAALAGCKDNEQSFYIEHMKAMPEPPDCEVSTGDPASYGILVDVAATRAFDYYGYFQVKNALVSRENYDNLTAESNNIYFDGSEVVVTLPGAGSAGSSEYRPIAQESLEAESSDVFPGISIPQSTFESMQATLGCQSAETTALQIANYFWNGTSVTLPNSETIGTGYGTILFMGHTGGDIDVETPQFTFAMNLCCNCSTNWAACLADPCAAFCGDAETNSCAFGINDTIPCTYWMSKLYDREKTWEEPGDIELADGGVGTGPVQVNCDTCHVLSE
jgi:hypothetical protein